VRCMRSRRRMAGRGARWPDWARSTDLSTTARPGNGSSAVNNPTIGTARRFPGDTGWRGLQGVAVMALKPCNV
jgi:hypothetical protein